MTTCWEFLYCLVNTSTQTIYTISTCIQSITDVTAHACAHRCTHIHTSAPVCLHHLAAGLEGRQIILHFAVPHSIQANLYAFVTWLCKQCVFLHPLIWSWLLYIFTCVSCRLSWIWRRQILIGRQKTCNPQLQPCEPQLCAWFVVIMICYVEKYSLVWSRLKQH